MIYANPNTEGSKAAFQSRCGNFIGGEFVPPVDGRYFGNPSPVNAKDIDLALDAAGEPRRGP